MWAWTASQALPQGSPSACTFRFRFRGLPLCPPSWGQTGPQAAVRKEGGTRGPQASLSCWVLSLRLACCPPWRGPGTPLMAVSTPPAPTATRTLLVPPSPACLREQFAQRKQRNPGGCGYQSSECCQESWPWGGWNGSWGADPQGRGPGEESQLRNRKSSLLSAALVSSL